MELALKTGLYDTSSGNMVWPEDDLRTIQLAVELGSGSKDKVAAQLSQAAARCVVRYLYGCPRLEFQVPEEVKDLNAGW
jgi:hypothetical protein